MNFGALEIELTRLTLAYAAGSLLGFMITMWALYHVIRAAIRDGIQESGLVETWSKTARAAEDQAESPARGT